MKRENKTVVITGASAGLGRAIAREFAKQKAFIGLIARNETRLKAAKSEVESAGGQALIFPMDVANASQMEMAAESIVKEWGSIDIWINNAMISIFSPYEKIKPEEYKRVTEVTYLGYVYGTLAALKSMKPQNKGIIIQIGSALAYRAIPLQSAYSAAKHAVQGFTESVRSELIHDKSNIKISMVQLPAINTTHFGWVKNNLKRKPRPIPPVFQPEFIAKAVLWSAYHYRREWYIGFSTAITIIGNKWMASFGDWFLAKKYKDQEYDGLADSNQPNNLLITVDGNFGSRGNFDKESSSHSPFTWMSQHRKWIFLSLVVIVFLLVIVY